MYLTALLGELVFETNVVHSRDGNTHDFVYMLLDDVDARCDFDDAMFVVANCCTNLRKYLTMLSAGNNSATLMFLS